MKRILENSFVITRDLKVLTPKLVSACTENILQKPLGNPAGGIM